ncbi:MAG: 2-hydroxyacyl-CoA dehydratase [Blautia sp.]|nr:2-hydroxyacyl-CoA dehydratase [Blautia sp.]
MLGYLCKYTPVEALEAVGAEMRLIEPSVTNFDQADTLMHPNMCSYVKGVLEELDKNELEGLVLTTCCDSVRRLYDVLKERRPDLFLYMLDLPRRVNAFTEGMYKKDIERCVKAYAEWNEGMVLRSTGTGGRFSVPAERGDGSPFQQNEGTVLRSAASGVRVGLMGARCPAAVRALLAEKGVRVVFDLTCTGQDRGEVFAEQAKVFGPGPKQEEDTGSRPDDAALSGYASALLNQIPCLRMVRATDRERYLEGFMSEIDGIVYHTVKFCDMYSFEYAKLHRESRLPILKLETDLTAQCEGQIRTRIEAFVESLEQGRAEMRQKETKQKAEQESVLRSTYVMGVDSGSTSTNAVILDQDAKIVAAVVIRTGAKTSESAEKAMETALREAGLQKEGLSRIVSTGYGRVSNPYADKDVTEISCHAKGARYFDTQVRTILDIGGQDSKAIRLDANGEVADFVMNDKCAAGTGRFLEAMARTLELDISELGPESLRSTEMVRISSMCTVFAESEVISLIAQNKEKADIARGVHEAIAGKSWSLLRRVGIEPHVMMTGGVARNPGVVKAIEEKIAQKLVICEQPDIVGAVGAALYALESLQKQ